MAPRGYTIKTNGGYVALGRSFRLHYHCEEQPCVIWTGENKTGLVLSFFTSPSGSGKSTFLRSLYTRLGGEVQKPPGFVAKLITWHRQRQMRSRQPIQPITFDFSPNYNQPSVENVSYIPQHSPMVNHWRLSDILPAYPKFLKCFLPDETIRNLKRKRIGEFSGGQRKKLYVCSALERLAQAATTSAFLLLDETFDGFGAVEAARCLISLQETWTSETNKSLHVLLVTHLNNNELLGNHAIVADTFQLEVQSETKHEKHVRFLFSNV